jgi:hypothetical protein
MGVLMRISACYILAGVLLCGGPLAAAETQVIPQTNVAPTLTAEQPANPASSKPGGPIIQSISARLGPQILNVTPELLLIDFHFVAQNGDAVILHRELVSTSANNPTFNPVMPINTPADGQKHGAVVTNDWHCNAGQYYVTMHAYVMDAAGNRSNEVQYTVHCNGG